MKSNNIMKLYTFFGNIPCSNVRPISTLLLLKELNAELEPLCLSPPLPPAPTLLPLDRSVIEAVGVRALVIPPGELAPLMVPNAFNVPGMSTVEPDVFLGQYKNSIYILVCSW